MSRKRQPALCAALCDFPAPDSAGRQKCQGKTAGFRVLLQRIAPYEAGLMGEEENDENE